jgi:hypothetical protein
MNTNIFLKKNLSAYSKQVSYIWLYLVRGTAGSKLFFTAFTFYDFYLFGIVSIFNGFKYCIFLMLILVIYVNLYNIDNSTSIEIS